MISRALLKSEIDKVKAEYLEVLFRIVKAFENGASSGSVQSTAKDSLADAHDWSRFISQTHGCMCESPISRGEQGSYEKRGEIQ